MAKLAQPGNQGKKNLSRPDVDSTLSLNLEPAGLKGYGLETKPKAWVQGVEPMKLLGFSHVHNKDQIEISIWRPHFFIIIIIIIIVIIIIPSGFFWGERHSRAPMDFEVLMQRW